jgi:hypothetical protein
MAWPATRAGIAAPSKGHHASTMASGARLRVQSTPPVGKSGLRGSDSAQIPNEVAAICEEFVRRDGQGMSGVDSGGVTLGCAACSSSRRRASSGG